MKKYEMLFLSELLKKSRINPHPDYVMALDYIYQRIDNMASDSSQFNSKMRWLKYLLPRFFLPKLLYKLRYDAMMGFCEENGKKKICGMVAFQKHPQKSRIGMFDAYISPECRKTDFLRNSQNFFLLVHQLTQEFQQSGYLYIQCGSNDTTKRLLRLYRRACRQSNWQPNIDIEASRIYI